MAAVDDEDEGSVKYTLRESVKAAAIGMEADSEDKAGNGQGTVNVAFVAVISEGMGGISSGGGGATADTAGGIAWESGFGTISAIVGSGCNGGWGAVRIADAARSVVRGGSGRGLAATE